jgi:hypothetical protein
MRRRYKSEIAVGLCGALALGAAGSAWADDNPFVGRWHWNRAESKVPSSEAVPADMVADFTRVDTSHVKWSVTVTSPQGQNAVEKFDTPANGEFYPINDDTTVAFRVNGLTLQGTFKGSAGQTDNLSCTVSADRHKMTCSGEFTGSDGKTEPYLDVYDRK